MGTESYSLGGARLYWLTVADGPATQVDTILGAIDAGSAGAYDLGNVVAAELAPEITYLDHFISYAGDRRKDKTVAVTKGINVPISFDEINATNIGLFFYTTDVSSSRKVIFSSNDIPPEGAAVLVFYTDIGQDLLFALPKCSLKTEGGNLAFNAEDWINLPFTLEVLHHKTYNVRTTATAAPFGFVDYSATSNAAPGM